MTSPSNNVPRLGIDGRVLDDRYHGIGRITYELLDRLTASPRCEITIFVGSRQRSGRFDIDRLAGRAGVRVVHFDNALTSAGQFLRWPGALRRAGIDIALFPYHLGASLFGARKRFAIVHDCILEAGNQFAPSTRTRALYILLTRLVISRTAIITPSLASAGELERFYGVVVPDSHVVEWGVGTSFGTPIDGTQASIGEMAAAAPGAAVAPVAPAATAATADTAAKVNGVRLPERYYLHVGARRPHKNVPQLVRVLARLGEREPVRQQHQQPAQREMLILVGTLDERWPDPTMDLARELGVADRILQFPRVSDSDLAALYRQARAFLYPSLVEGFGLPLLEAMAAGTPVIASDIPVFREVAASAAVYVPPFDASAWVRAIRGLDDADRRAALIDDGRRRAAAATWEKAASQLESILLGR